MIAKLASERKIWLGICGSKSDRFIILNPNPGVSMRLSCLKAFLLAVPLTMACRETTAPSRMVSRFYVLESISGQPVPAVLFASEFDTTRILWSTLSLDADGKAVRVEHVSSVSTTSGSKETTNTTLRHYEIIGDSITLSPANSCSCCFPCALILNQVGKLTDSALTLTYDVMAPQPIYLYRLVKAS
jgi:hypothetical protein